MISADINCESWCYLQNIKLRWIRCFFKKNAYQFLIVYPHHAVFGLYLKENRLPHLNEELGMNCQNPIYTNESDVSKWQRMIEHLSDDLWWSFCQNSSKIDVWEDSKCAYTEAIAWKCSVKGVLRNFAKFTGKHLLLQNTSDGCFWPINDAK